MPLPRGEPAERRPNALDLVLGFFCGCCRRLERTLVSSLAEGCLQHFSLVMPGPQMIDEDVAGDPVQPRGEFGLTSKPCHSPAAMQADLPRNVFSVIRVFDMPEGPPHNSAAAAKAWACGGRSEGLSGVHSWAFPSRKRGGASQQATG